MPEHLFPGVFVEEAASGMRAIAGVPTSTTAFVGATAAGPVDGLRTVGSFAEYEAQFGGLSAGMPLGYAVQQYFPNGGREAVIARVVPTGASLTDADLSSPALEGQQRGLWLLDRAERFNILCIPPLSRSSDVGRATWDAAIAYASRRRAMAIIDPPEAWAAAPTLADVTAMAPRSPNAALYYPRLRAADPLRGNQLTNFAPCGAVAGIYARTDASRGVWKAPAGTEATVIGAQGPSIASHRRSLQSSTRWASTPCARCLPAQPCSGAAHAGARRRGPLQIRSGAAARTVHRIEHHSRPGMDSVRAERTIALGTGCARASKTSCSASFIRAHCKATRRSRRSSCVATPRP